MRPPGGGRGAGVRDAFFFSDAINAIYLLFAKKSAI